MVDEFHPSSSPSEARLRLACAILNGLMVNAKEGGSANDYTRAIVSSGPERLHHGRGVGCVKMTGWLVGEDHRAAGAQGASDGDPLLLAT